MFLSLMSATGGEIALNIDLIISVRQRAGGGCVVTLADGSSMELGSDGAKQLSAAGIPNLGPGTDNCVDIRESAEHE